MFSDIKLANTDILKLFRSQSPFIVKNTGNVSDSFLITSKSIISKKWKVGVWDINNIDRTQMVFNAGWLLRTIKPGESIKFILKIYAFSGQVIDPSNPPTQSINITAQSWKDLSSKAAIPASDTVTATVVLTKTLQ